MSGEGLPNRTGRADAARLTATRRRVARKRRRTARAEQAHNLVTHHWSLRFGLLVRTLFRRVFFSEPLGSLLELSDPLAQGLAYLREFPHAEYEQEDDQDDEKFWQSQIRHNVSPPFQHRDCALVNSPLIDMRSHAPLVDEGYFTLVSLVGTLAAAASATVFPPIYYTPKRSKSGENQVKMRSKRGR